MPNVVAKLPLDSPLWKQLSACYSAENAIAQLREVVATRTLGEAWRELRDEMLHQGSVYGVSSAAISHLVDVAPYLPAESRRELWIDIGFLVTAGADRFPSPRAEGLQEGLTAALGTAGALAVRDFLAHSGSPDDDDCYSALACVALAGHRAARAMWRFPSASSGYVEVACPGCRTRRELDGFADPLALPCPVPAFGPTLGRPGPWREVARAVEQARRDQVLGPGWGRFFDTARRVAQAGVPSNNASHSAVWCLVAAMVATRPDAPASRARTLARLTGHFRCLDCGKAWTIADAMDDKSGAEPVRVAEDQAGNGWVQGALFMAEDNETAGVPSGTVADKVAGFRPALSRKLATAHLTERLLWHTDSDAVDALTVTDTVVVSGGSAGVSLRNLASGAPQGPVLGGTAIAVASLALPDGESVIAASGDDGSLHWWDTSTGQPLDSAPTGSTAPVLSLAPVLMPASGGPSSLAAFRGRTMLAAGDVEGTVRLWDPVTRAPLPVLFERPGRRVVSLTAVNFVNQPPRDGTDLVTVYDDLLVDVWGSASVHGRLSAMAPDPAKLAAAGHQHITAAAVSPRRLGHRRPILLADRNGTVSMWETFGVRLGDPLPPDPANNEVTGIAVLEGPGAAIIVVASSRASGTLRVWEPLLGTATLLPLTVRPRCVLNVGGTLLIGHDGGLLALSLTVTPT